MTVAILTYEEICIGYNRLSGVLKMNVPFYLKDSSIFWWFKYTDVTSFIKGHVGPFAGYFGEALGLGQLQYKQPYLAHKDHVKDSRSRLKTSEKDYNPIVYCRLESPTNHPHITKEYLYNDGGWNR